MHALVHMNVNATRNRPKRDPRVIEGVIANLSLMEGVSRNGVQYVAAQSSLLEAVRGQILVRRGERVAGLFAVAYGSVKTRLANGSGDELVLSLLGPGTTFAVAPAILDRPSKLDAVALADSLLAVIPAAGLMWVADREPRLARNLATTLAERTQALLGEFEAGLLRSAQRLASYLNSIAQPAETPGQWAARLPVSKTLVAARLGVKKETLSRLLKQLATRGLISVEQREITILDREALAAVATGAQAMAAGASGG